MKSAILCFGIFGAITILVATDNLFVLTLDHTFLQSIRLLAESNQTWFQIISWPFNPVIFVSWFSIFLAICWYQKQKNIAYIAALSVVIAQLVQVTTKFWVDRPRSDLALIEAFGPSFPSGHSLTATIFGAVCIQYFTHGKFRILQVIIISGLVILVSGSRLGLLVHYPSDIIAGITLGLSIFLITKKFKLIH